MILWTRSIALGEAVASELGIKDPRKFIERKWTRMHVPPPQDGWFQWQAREMRSGGSGSSRHYKLYISPQPDFIRDAFHASVEALAESDAHHFKIGKDAAGLLRPDKMVAYFSSFESLQD